MTYTVLAEVPRGPLDQEAVDRLRESGLDDLAAIAQALLDRETRRRNRWYRRLFR